jgi:hypothetical protein
MSTLSNRFEGTAGRVRILALAGVCTFTLALNGCSGGGGVSLGSGQGTDPATVDFPLAYIKRRLPTDPQAQPPESDARLLQTFNVDADLYLRDRASSSAPERNITQRVTGDIEQWDVRDLEASYDGNLVIFAMRGPFDANADEEDLPTWNIWEYNRLSDTLRRVIPSDNIAEEGQDVAPHYLPDGRIVFSSTRQRQSRAILLDEGKPQFAAEDEDRNESAFVLHVMNADGSDIHQISFNQSHDLDPSVLSNGQLIFTRWDHVRGSAHNEMSLYRMNPDGRDLQLLYGARSHLTGFNNSEIHFLQPRQLLTGRVLTLARPFVGTFFGSDILAIDTANYVENTQPTLPNIGVLSGPAQERAVVNDVRLIPPAPSPGGVFSGAFPLHDGTNRFLVSWSLCRVLENGNIVPCTDDRLADPNVQTAPPLYGIWIYDMDRDTQIPVVAPEEGVIITDVVTMQAYNAPPVIFDGVAGVDLDATLVSEGVGLLDIRSVYDIEGVDTATPNIATLANPAITTADQRPVRFVRLEKAVSLPDEDVRDFSDQAFGVGNFMREILAYAPVEPDGSVRVKVPANVAFGITLLDRNGRRIGPRHDNWLQVRPGEVLRCNGCHDPASTQSHGRADLFASINPGATTTGLPFPGTDPALFADAGETMAQTRARHSCSLDNCSALLPSVNVVFEDVWTNPAVRAPDAPFSYRYDDLQTTSPTTLDCETRWSAGCRIVINYETIIHPLWSLPRLVTDPTDPTIVLADNTCTRCHSPRDAANALRVPAGQLDLSDGPSPDQAEHFNAYRELLFTDNAQTLNMGALEDQCLQTDPVTGLCVAFATVNPSMVAGSANASGQFFNRFNAGGTHGGYLSDAERRLIAEWLDIGAQYYNNPFAAPLN